MRRSAFRTLRSAAPLVLVTGALGVALFAYFQSFGSGLMDRVTGWTAASAAFPLQLLGTDVDVRGTIVASDQFAYNIVAECTLIGPLLLYIAAVLAYPVGLASKASGVALGLLAIGGLNLVRLVSLFYVGTYAPQHLDVAHLVVWQGVMVLSVVLLWLYWVQRSGRARTA